MAPGLRVFSRLHKAKVSGVLAGSGRKEVYLQTRNLYEETTHREAHGQLQAHSWRFMGSYKWVISRVTILITYIRGLITPIITTHEPPSISPEPLRETLKVEPCSQHFKTKCCALKSQLLQVAIENIINLMRSGSLKARNRSNIGILQHNTSEQINPKP